MAQSPESCTGARFARVPGAKFQVSSVLFVVCCQLSAVRWSAFSPQSSLLCYQLSGVGAFWSVVCAQSSVLITQSSVLSKCSSATGRICAIVEKS